jgi:hypothetical protein
MKQQTKEIIYNIVNSLLAGGLVFLGSLSNGDFSWSSVLMGIIASSVVAVTQFKDYLKTQEREYCRPKLFNFI